MRFRVAIKDQQSGRALEVELIDAGVGALRGEESDGLPRRYTPRNDGPFKACCGDR